MLKLCFYLLICSLATSINFEAFKFWVKNSNSNKKVKLTPLWWLSAKKKKKNGSHSSEKEKSYRVVFFYARPSTCRHKRLDSSDSESQAFSKKVKYDSLSVKNRHAPTRTYLGTRACVHQFQNTLRIYFRWYLFQLIEPLKKSNQPENEFVYWLPRLVSCHVRSIGLVACKGGRVI